MKVKNCNCNAPIRPGKKIILSGQCSCQGKVGLLAVLGLRTFYQLVLFIRPRPSQAARGAVTLLLLFGILRLDLTNSLLKAKVYSVCL